MEIAITGRHVTVSDRLRDYLDSKLSKVPQLDPRVQRIEVMVSHEPNPRQSKVSERVEITCRSKGPVIRAEAATAWPWLPVEKARTPAARSASVSDSSVLSAPRILKEPVSCRASALTSTVAPQSSSSIGEESRGVRRTRPSSRSLGC